ncbi:hypothetical protein EI94DRAFT_1701648 [Lactarius quietus]|nr:hypothetical protein EI94DRAFT_1701648 [Lactarius quietus]
MSSTTLDLQELFENALKEYEGRAGTKLLEHEVSIKLRSCDSANSVIEVLQTEAQKFHKFRRDDGKVMKWLKRTVYVLHALSTSELVGQSVRVPFPPAQAIFAGIGVLLSSIKDVSASYDALIDLFEFMESFLQRLDIYANIPPTAAMTEILLKILIELLSTLALVTQQVKQGRLTQHVVEKFGKKLFGENEVESVLQRFDRLTQEEARTTAAQTLEVAYRLVKSMKEVVDASDGKAQINGIRESLGTLHLFAWDSKTNRGFKSSYKKL